MKNFRKVLLGLLKQDHTQGIINVFNHAKNSIKEGSNPFEEGVNKFILRHAKHWAKYHPTKEGIPESHYKLILDDPMLYLKRQKLEYLMTELANEFVKYRNEEKDIRESGRFLFRGDRNLFEE